MGRIEPIPVSEGPNDCSDKHERQHSFESFLLLPFELCVWEGDAFPSMMKCMGKLSSNEKDSECKPHRLVYMLGWSLLSLLGTHA